VLIREYHSFRHSGIAIVGKAKRRVGNDLGAETRDKISFEAIHLIDRLFIVVANTEIEREAFCDTIVVLGEALEEVIALVLALTIKGEKTGPPQKEVGHCVAAVLAVEGKRPVIERGVARSEANRVPSSPKFPGTFAFDPCHRIVEVVGPV